MWTLQTLEPSVKAMNTSVHLSRTSSAKTIRTHYTDDAQEEAERYDVTSRTDAFLTEVDTEDEEGDRHQISSFLAGLGPGRNDPLPARVQTPAKHVDFDDSGSDTEEIPSRNSSPDYDTDLEMDIEPEPKLEDLTGVELYVALCQRVGIVPLSCVKNNIHKTHFHMPHRGIGAAGVQALAPPIAMSPNARYINLSNNMIGPEGCAFISTMVSHNVFITDLDLSYNQLGSRGLTILCLPIRDSGTLVNLDISNNEFEDKDAQYLADIIENNISLRNMNLCKNMFSIEAGKILGTAIANNDTLQNLNLSWNALRLEGAQAFAKGVAGNSGLKNLNLSMNGFSTEGTRALGIALTLNQYLEHLDLSFNRVSNNAAADFARYFKINTTLKTIKLYGNPIMYDGAQEILAAISENERSAVHSLDLTGLMVHQEFVDMVKDINHGRPFHAEYGVVSQGKNIEGTIDRFADKNPLEILLIFMGEMNLRLVDLFRTFDKDQSGGLTHEEFIMGLKEINTPLSSSQLDELIEMLDKDGDGEIDLKEILNINREFKDIKMKANRFVQEEKLQKKLEKEGKKETELGAFTKEAMAMKQRSQTTVGIATEAFGAGASNTTAGSVSAPPTAISNEQKSLEGGEPAADTQQSDLPAALSTQKFTVTAEEAAELNTQVKSIKMKGALSMWKNKTLV